MIKATLKEARECAIELHGNQLYGHHPYIIHPDRVVFLLQRFGASLTAQIAGYLHDTKEDTGVTLEELKQKFGEEVALIVDLVTDKPGKNRLERHLNTYYLIRTNKEAVMVKLCDRLANMENCVANRSKNHAQMYEKEYMQFKFALYTPNEFEEIWAELDGVFSDVKKISRG